MKQTGFSNNGKEQQNPSKNTGVGYFRLSGILPLFVLFLVVYLIFQSSCANMGTPSGGDKDTIPPVLVRTIPNLRGTNFTGSELRFTFDEFVMMDEISEKLVISPPMKKKPLVKMKGKTLIIEFAQDPRKESTYSLDFKDAVADNNEKNPIKDFRFSFSTGNKFDSLRVAGYVKNAFNQEPVEKAMVMLYRDTLSQAFTDSIPDYIGTTDKGGFFVIDNVAEGAYRLYALNDSDNSMTYNSNSELIAFADSLMIPSARFEAENDTIIKGNDTLVVSGHVDYFPGLQYLMMFEEEKFDQYLDSYKRNQANKCEFYFSETLSDSFDINLIKPVPTNQLNWKYIESNLKRDSITVWLTDTLISSSDTLRFQLKYEVLDSLNQLIMKVDTTELIYNSPKIPKPKRKKNEVVIPPTINLNDNINSSGHDIYQRINIEAPEPLASFDTSMVRLYSVIDTIKTKISVVVQKDSTSIRKYYIEHNWEPNSDYELQIDSAAARNIYGYPSNGVKRTFKTQKEDFYGKIIMKISKLEGAAIVQLISNDKEENILQKIQILEEGKIEFPYLKPGKYKIRLIFDSDKNGRWDTGYLAGNLQPERVIYYPKIIKVRSNFEYKENWQISYDSSNKKVIVDDELEKEKARKLEQERKNKERAGEQ